MSFSQFIKDYIDAINDLYDFCSGNITFLPFLQFSLSYLGQMAKFSIEYILRFRWLIDFCSIKIVIPEIIYSNFFEEYSLEDPKFRFFKFFQVQDPSAYSTYAGIYLVGLCNSFFYCLPFSSGNLLWLRRVTLDGLFGSIAAAQGIFLAQAFILLSTLFGFRFILFPWLSYEIVHYVAGVVLIIFLVPGLVIKPLTRTKATETFKLRKIFLFHLGFTLTEQTTFYQYLSNLTISAEPTIFEGNNLGTVESFLNPIYINCSYLIGLYMGMVGWYTLWGLFFVWLGHALSKNFNFMYSRWVRGVHKSSMILMITIMVTSLPYYNVDFVVTGPLGFVRHDEAARSFHTKTYSRDYRKGRLGEYSLYTSYDTDPAPYDHGRYVTGREVELTYEDLNYQGEYAWRSRYDRLSVGSRGKVNRWLRTFIPIFRKSKSEESQAEILPDNLAEESPNRWKYFDIYSTIFPFFSNQEDLIQRFVEDYQGDLARSSFPDKEVGRNVEPPYVPLGEFSRYAFDFFAGSVEYETDDFEEALGRRLKMKYYSNYVYRNILRADMSLFLTRQPRKHRLKVNEENRLFKKRQILGSYYDSIRAYSKLPYYEAYSDLFLGPKSYANRVYNQQFKGTFKVLKKLFSISLEYRENPSKKSILKYDQPLYTFQNNELPVALHEDLMTNKTISELKNQESFFEETNPMPFYVGFSSNFRRFYVTNYFIAHSDANTKTNFYNKKKKKSETIHFLTWPIPDSKIEDVKRSAKPPLNSLFIVYDDRAYAQERDLFEFPVGEKVELVFKTLPSLVRRIDLRDREKIRVPLHPLPGGYVWANNKPLKIKFKKRLRDYLPEEIRKQIDATLSIFNRTKKRG